MHHDHHGKENEGKKMYLLLIRIAIILFIVGLYLSWLDNGPRFLFF